MFSKIMVPVDLEHAATLEKAIRVAADMAKQYQAEIHLVGVTMSAPGAVAHNPAEYELKLQQFAADHSAQHDCAMTSKMLLSNDPAVEVNNALEEYSREIGADLVVMASHVPGFKDLLFPSHAGHVATHTDISVFIVR